VTVVCLPMLVVLVGAAGAGKSTWCVDHVAAHQVVSLDRLRALVADDPGDQSATPDAVELGTRLVTARLGRGLPVTVVDATNLDPAHRRDLITLAARHHGAAVAVTFTTPLAQCLRRNAHRPGSRRVPEAVLRAQHAAFQAALDTLPVEGFTGVHDACCLPGHPSTGCLLSTWSCGWAAAVPAAGRPAGAGRAGVTR